VGLLDRLLGREPPPEPAGAGASSPRTGDPTRLTDEQAVERYRYLVRTAPPERVEQAHEEAFARLTPEQRRAALQELGGFVPEEERAASDDPRSLARMATRAELRRPGTVERAFGGAGGMGGLGMGGSLLGSFAAAFAGTVVAQALFSELAGADEASGGGDSDAGAEGDAGGDFGGGDWGGGDIGGGDIGF
jgi:hypothetical protein